MLPLLLDPDDLLATVKRCDVEQLCRLVLEKQYVPHWGSCPLIRNFIGMLCRHMHLKVVGGPSNCVAAHLDNLVPAATSTSVLKSPMLPFAALARRQIIILLEAHSTHFYLGALK